MTTPIARTSHVARFHFSAEAMNEARALEDTRQYRIELHPPPRPSDAAAMLDQGPDFGFDSQHDPIHIAAAPNEPGPHSLVMSTFDLGTLGGPQADEAAACAVSWMHAGEYIGAPYASVHEDLRTNAPTLYGEVVTALEEHNIRVEVRH